MADDTGTLGPISYLIVEVKGDTMTGEGLPVLAGLADSGIIRILDLAFMAKDSDGSLRMLELSDLDADGTMGLAVFEGASSGLIDETDLADASPAIEPGTVAAIVIFENRWATGFVDALRRGGAELVAAGYIPQDAVLAALDATES